MRLKLILLSLTLVALLSFASCGQQDSAGGSTTDQAVTTEENLPEFTDTIPETEETTEADSKEGVKDGKEDATEFSGLDVQETTEIELDEGQDAVVY